jgi:hypothetical protein
LAYRFSAELAKTIKQIDRQYVIIEVSVLL